QSGSSAHFDASCCCRGAHSEAHSIQTCYYIATPLNAQLTASRKDAKRPRKPSALFFALHGASHANASPSVMTKGTSRRPAPRNAWRVKESAGFTLIFFHLRMQIQSNDAPVFILTSNPFEEKGCK
uniref:Uncharacterized protein n=1 Tax=Gasterosteus aculeatus TaxID=69293 RepID=G3Q7B7_GASAC